MTLCKKNLNLHCIFWIHLKTFTDWYLEMAQAHHEYGYVYCSGDDGDEARSEELEKEIVQDQKSEVTGESITFEEHLKSSGLADSISVGELKGGFQVFNINHHQQYSVPHACSCHCSSIFMLN